ncbi:MAG: hypothetical protein DRP08_08245, partial [Candidatus Aenigmatarchaeota archaeon]
MVRRVVRRRKTSRQGTALPYPSPKKTIFFKPKYLKYSEIVRIDTPDAARGSVKILLREFRNAETRAKKRRIKWMCVLAANRAKAARKKGNLSPREKREFAEVKRIYREAVEKMKLPPRKAS